MELAAIDEDGNGSISLAELMQWWARTGRGAPPKRWVAQAAEESVPQQPAASAQGEQGAPQAPVPWPVQGPPSPAVASGQPAAAPMVVDTTQKKPSSACALL
jgi:hypothetical protein